MVMRRDSGGGDAPRQPPWQAFDNLTFTPPRRADLGAAVLIDGPCR